MKTGLSSVAVLVAGLSSAVVLVSLAVGVHATSDAEYYACYSSAGSMTKMAEDEFQSRGECRTTCVDNSTTNDNGNGWAVMGMTKGTLCYCGNLLPNSAYKVNDSYCKQPCGGFSSETCGSRLGEYFSVYTTGLEANPDEDPAPSSSSSKSQSSTSDSDSTSTAHSGTNGGSNATSTSSSDSSSSVNKAGVAVGAVIGVLAIIGIGVGVFVFLRKRRRQKVEEDYRRSAAVRGFNQKPALDTRLDPVMVQRRDSVGSIADNQDYSRKILRVTNPDG